MNALSELRWWAWFVVMGVTNILEGVVVYQFDLSK